MNDPNEIVYCLACQRPMMAVDNVCRACGADQAILRSQQAPPGAAGDSTFVTGMVRCAQCGGGMPPNATFCAFCGNRVVPIPPADSRAARVLLLCALLSSVIALFACPPLFGLVAVLLGFMGTSRLPGHWAGPTVIGVSIACTLLGLLIYFVRAAQQLGQGLM